MKPQQLFAVIIALTVAALVIALAPVIAPRSPFAKQVSPRLGLDIQGGARVVLKADTTKLPAGQKWGEETQAAVLRTLDNRVNANGVAEPIITPKGTDQFVIEIPAVENNAEILEQLQKTAQLEFYYNPEWKSQKSEAAGYWRYDLQVIGENGAREQYKIFDSKTNITFRDRFHINEALRALISAGSGATGAVETPLPAPLETLGAAGGKKSVAVSPADAPKLAELAEELTLFDGFLKQARKQLDGSDLKPTAKGGFDQGGSAQAIVELEFNETGKQKFAKFTKDHTREILMIYLDGRILMAPNIDEPILNGKALIRPFPNVKEAKKLADYLNGGALPVPLEIVQRTEVDATLGQDAVRHGFVAGLVGLLAVIGFMLAVYRLPGAVASFALILYTLFTYAIFVLVPVTFTLPGIAGFILSVGMAVDANILIFERTKEELRAGKAVRQAVISGFQRAFSAIFDSNLCSVVTALLLYNFGTGSVRGFALTLMIGVALSMFTAITVTRTILLLMVGDGTNRAIWGADRLWRPKLNVVKRRKTFYAISLAVIVPGILFALLGGFKTGIDFTGGAEITMSLPQAVSRETIEKAAAEVGVKDASAQTAGGNTVFLRLPKEAGKPEMTGAEADELVTKLQGKFPGLKKQSFEQIGASISSEITRNALTSVLYSSIFIVLYLAFRFAIGGFVNGFKFGVGAIIAMLHDVALLIGVFCILGYFLNWKIDSLFVTAALTVIGFSVHDTIVIFDRIRENLRHANEKTDFETLVDDSINETFARSVFTSLTVVITLVALLIFGGPVIRPLNAALLVGILSGTYSSIFNAAPLVVDWNRLFGKKGATSASPAAEKSVAAKPAPETPASAKPASPKPAAPKSSGTPRPGAWESGPRRREKKSDDTASGETPASGQE